jgi:peptidoglycan/LPS O-acetylase OafA/YrhL
MRNQSIDTLRFLLTLAVVVGHAFLSLVRQGNELWALQNIAVDGFFVISGYFIANSCSKRLCSISVGNEWNVFTSFTFHRFKRLWIEYAFAVVITIILSALVFHKTNTSTLPLNLLLITQINRVGGIINGSWYISVLFWEGALISWFLICFREEIGRFVIYAGAFLSFAYLYGVYGNLSINAYPLLFNFLSAGFLKGFMDMGLGIAVYEFCQKFCKIRKNKLVIEFLESVALIFIVYSMAGTLGHRDFLGVIGFAILMGLLSFKEGFIYKFLNLKFWSEFNKSSYMLYLTHGELLLLLGNYMNFHEYHRSFVYLIAGISCVAWGWICFWLCNLFRRAINCNY